MPQDARQLSFPPGTELVFGPQAERRQFINDAVAAVFRAWGFSDIVLPAFDFAETFEGDETELYSLIDREGRRLILRADFTLIAAKALAIELRRQPRPIRASYEGRVYRFAPSGHGHRVEVPQRGLEWVNARGAEYDAALLMLTRECLDAVGAGDALVVVGHGGFINAALGETGRRDRRLHEALDHKNPSRIRELAARLNVDRDAAALLEAMPMLTGGAEIFAAARAFNLSPEAEAGLGELEALHNLLTEAGAADRIIFDLGEVRRSNYYSGFMFKLYHAGVGGDLGGGGRYDRLFDRFGMNVPALGLGFNLARLAEATSRNDYSGNGEVIPPHGAEALKKIADLRRQGKAVRLEGDA